MLNEFEKEGTWADGLIITSMAKFLMTDIKVASMTNSREQPWTTFSGTTELHKDNSRENIYMCYVNGCLLYTSDAADE